jgi:DNA processing protein
MQSTAPTQLTDGERLERLRLTRTESVGPVTFRQLMARFGTAAEAIEALPELARRGGRHRPIRICPRDEAERERDALAAFGGTHLFPGEAGYPDTLSAIDDAPMVLSVVGAAPLLKREAVAVVGARNASTSGRSFARRLAADLAAAGLVVVSGMARGIDAAAHAGAAEATVAVLAGGVDVIYPRENADLYARIREQGLLVSEMPFGLQPQARHFPRRNRIISGLSRGVLVVEAALRSGSLITARLAAEQGRDVFAVPGSPLDPRCRGPNDLIRKGAILTESAEDILSELQGTFARHPILPSPQGPAEPRPGNDPPADLPGQILERLGLSPVSVDDLVRDTGRPAGHVRGALLELELAGRIERRPGDFVARLVDPQDHR